MKKGIQKTISVALSGLLLSSGLLATTACALPNPASVAKSAAKSATKAAVQQTAHQVEKEATKAVAQASADAKAYDAKAKQVPTDGFYSSKLNAQQKKVYQSIVSGITDKQKSIAVLDINNSEQEAVFNAVFAENPQFFYCNRKAGWKKRDDGTKKTTYFDPTYNEYLGKDATFNSAVDQFLAGAPKSGSDYDKVLYVHDKIVADTSYVLGKGSAYDCLVNHSANCEGHSFATKLLLNKLGVTCRIVSGSSLNAQGAWENHMWTVVTVDGKDYILDTTWDNPAGKAPNFVSQRYFLCSKDQLAKTHKPKDPANIASCTNTDINWYKKNGLYFDTYEASKTKLPDIVANSVNKGEYNVAVQYASEAECKKALDDLFEKGAVYDILEKANSKTGNKIDTEISWDPTTVLNVCVLNLQKA